MVRTINKNILSDDQMMVDYLRDQERTVTDAHKRIDQIKAMADKALAAANRPVDPKSLQAGSNTALNVTGLTGKLIEPQFADVPLLSTHPDPLTVPYNLYVLLGAPNSLWTIKRDVNPPVKFQIL